MDKAVGQLYSLGREIKKSEEISTIEQISYFSYEAQARRICPQTR